MWRIQDLFGALLTLLVTVAAVQSIAGPARAQEPPLRVAKSFEVSSVTVGDTTSLTIEISNSGPAELTGVSFTDSLPPGLVVANPSNLGALTGCTHGNVTAEPGGQSVNLSGANVPTGSTCRLSLHVTAVRVGVHSTFLTVTSDQGTGTSSISSITVGPGLAAIDITSSTVRGTFGSSIKLTATIAIKIVGVPVPTGIVTFMDGSNIVGVADLTNDGVAVLSADALPVGERSITARYGGDKHFAPGSSSPLLLTIGKSVPTVTISPSPDRAVFGEMVNLSAKVRGSGRTPTGNVSFQHSLEVLGTAALSADGVATISISKLRAGKHEIIALYEGDGTFSPSSSDSLFYQIDKASSSTAIHLSSNRIAVGDTLTVEAKVVSRIGITPTGSISFHDGLKTIVTPLSALGSATYHVTMGEGVYKITATYSGDENLAGSVSPASILDVQSPSYVWNPGFTLLAAILLLALFVPLTRLIFRQIGRALRALRRLPARVAGRVKLLQRFSRARTVAAAESAVGVGVGALNRALAGATEIEQTIARDFNRNSVDLRKKGIICTWIDPVAPQFSNYNRDQAELDAPKVKHFLSAEIPLQADPLNLFDDIVGAFEVHLFKDSDKAVFYVLWEFKRAITGNVMALSVYFSVIMFSVLITNVFFSTAFDFYGRLGLSGRLPVNFELFGSTRKFDVSPNFVDSLAFAILSCLLGAGLMWFFSRTVYSPLQRYNGQHLKTYLVGNFAAINGSFRQVHNSATQTIILVGRNLDQMKKDTVLWNTTLLWMAFRAFFIESYLRNVLFQIRRNSSYYVLLVPLAFLAGLLGVIFVLNRTGLYAFDLWGELGRLNVVFYAAFLLLFWLFFNYLKTSLSFVWESVEAHEWLKFNQLAVQDTMTDIMHSYVTELDKWVSKYSGPEHG